MAAKNVNAKNTVGVSGNNLAATDAGYRNSVVKVVDVLTKDAQGSASYLNGSLGKQTTKGLGGK